MHTSTTAPLKSAGQYETKSLFTKRIGSTIYEVNIGFNQNSKETMDEIILRLIKNESESGRFAG